MTAQGVMSSPTPVMKSMLSGFSFAGGSVKETTADSFEQFMETSKGGKEQKLTARSPESGTKEKTVGSEKIRERAKELFSGKSKVKDADTSQAGESVKDFEEAAEAVSSLMVQIRQVICEELGITEEELTATMDELDLTDADLLDRNSLQDIFLKLNHASEPTEFLTNEELFDGFADLMQAVEQTVQESGLTSEECRAVLEERTLLPETADTEFTPEIKAAELTEDTPETETETEVQNEGYEAGNGLQKPAAQTETKTESGNTGEERHTATAKKDGADKVISSETDANLKNVFIDTLTDYAVTGTGEEALAAAEEIREIANQIMEQIKIVIRPEQTNMELQLNPEHLGRVHLTITEKEGMMTAQFTTQTEIAKEAIESQVAALRESLQNQGIKVEAIEVTVSEFGFERDRDAQQSENGGQEKRKRQNGFRVEETDEAPQTTEFIRTTDSSVDYSA